MARRRRHTRTPLAHRNWFLREHGGAPGWAIIALLLVLVALLGYAVTHAAP